MGQDWSRKKIRRFQERLLSWYRHHRRILPWRSEPTPYRVWIAEIMLQQTRVQTVLPYYKRFLKRFPDIAALADAPQPEVLEYWAGLGYYRRARYLHEAAQRMMYETGGRFPDTLEGIRRLPGIGRYTAGAIYSIAFHKPEPVVDGNVRRIISRLFGIADAPESFCWHQAGSLLAREDPADFNQAMMELGALVCIPARPDCLSCPIRSLCRTGDGSADLSKRGRTKAEQETIEMVMLVIECAGKVALARPDEAPYIPGEWGLPLEVVREGSRVPACARSLARRILGSTPPLRRLQTIRHAITYRRIRAQVYGASLPPPIPELQGNGNYAWFPHSQLSRMLTSSLYRKGVKGMAEKS